MEYLTQVGPNRFNSKAIPVVALAHNEANILSDFLEHYRSLGPVTFLIVNDASTDGTGELLFRSSDVTVFQPNSGSTYRQHKARWRAELLNAFGVGQWCLVPDLDEHFVFSGAEGLLEYISQLEREGAEAVATLMIDMYADAPLKSLIHPADSEIPLGRRFNLFDGPESYAMRPVIGRTGRNYPTPPISFHGGPRHRLQFGRIFHDENPFIRSLLKKYLSLDRPIAGHYSVVRDQFIARIAKRYFSGALNLTKLGLVRWQEGMLFNGGAHKLNKRLPISESIAAFLHYPFTRGELGIEYTSNRGQHVGNGKHYMSLLDSGILGAMPKSW